MLPDAVSRLVWSPYGRLGSWAGWLRSLLQALDCAWAGAACNCECIGLAVLVRWCESHGW
jgi:hypothetical protein